MSGNRAVVFDSGGLKSSFWTRMVIWALWPDAFSAAPGPHRMADKRWGEGAFVALAVPDCCGPSRRAAHNPPNALASGRATTRSPRERSPTWISKDPMP